MKLAFILLLAATVAQAQITGADLIKGVNSPTGNSFVAAMKARSAMVLTPADGAKYYYVEKSADKCLETTTAYYNTGGDCKVTFSTTSAERFKALATSFGTAGFAELAKTASAPVEMSDVSTTNPGIILKVTIAQKADACGKTQTFYTIMLAR